MTMFNNNLIALALTMAIALFWLRVNNFIVHRGWVSSDLSRKIIHIGTGPIFVLCWLFFNDSGFAPFLAAVVPLGITLQFALVGTGVIRDQAAVEAMSRTGIRQEILRGPLFYGIAFVLITIIFWRNSPNGIVALMILCGGDGLADIVGKKVESARLPWSHQKSIAGSLTMFLGGFLLTVGILWIFVEEGYFSAPITQYLIPVGYIAVVATLIESLPFKDVDNITVPLVSVLLGFLVF